MGPTFDRRDPRLALPALARLDLAGLPAGLWAGFSAGLWAGLRRPPRAALLAALGPVFGMLLVLGGALLAVDEYAAHEAEVRRAETGRYLAEFREPPVAGAWGRLSVAWQAERDRQHVLLERVAAATDGHFDLAVRNYRDFVLDTIDEHRLSGDIETVRGFFLRLGACIKMGSCDPTAAAAQLGPAVWQFRNQHYYYFALEGLAAEVDRSALLIAPPAGREPAARS